VELEVDDKNLGQGGLRRLSDVLIELRHSQAALRILSILMAGSVFFDLIEPCLLMLTEETSLYHKIAWMTPYPIALAMAFAGSAVLTLPYFFMQCFWPHCRERRYITRWTCYLLFFASLLWMYLAWESRTIELWPRAAVFFRTGLGSLTFSLALALSLNKELSRLLMERAR
jgi:hypothetical protein